MARATGEVRRSGRSQILPPFQKRTKIKGLGRLPPWNDGYLGHPGGSGRENILALSSLNPDMPERGSLPATTSWLRAIAGADGLQPLPIRVHLNEADAALGVAGSLTCGFPTAKLWAW
jgi:hypothetical protein